MKTASSITQLGSIMGIWAHPDDETFSMAGIMAAAAKNNQQVVCITATRGEAGVQDEARWPTAQLGNIRTKELKEALSVLGVTEHIFLDYNDGGCADVDVHEVVDRLTELIDLHKPDSIFTFGPDGMTGHSDHQAVSAWTVAAVNKAVHKSVLYFALQTTEQYEASIEADKNLNLFFNINKPPTKDQQDCDVCFCLDNEYMSLKKKALAKMPSQTEKLLSTFKHQLPLIIGTEAFTRYTK